MKSLALYFKCQRFEPQRWRFFIPTVVSGLLPFIRPEKVLWTIKAFLFKGSPLTDADSAHF